MAFQYRFYHDTNLPDLERLWAEKTDWGMDTLQSLQDWFMEAPFGKPRIVVATDTETGEIVGQFRFMPSRVSVNGRELRAVRPFGTIIGKQMSDAARTGNVLDQPAVAMYSCAARELQALGEQFIYMVPDPRWVRLFKMLPMLKHGSFPLWSLPVPLSSPLPLGEGCTAGALSGWDERVDRLWEAASHLHGCSVVRDSRTLPWKLGHAKYTTTAVERGGELIGLVASRPKGDRQWLVCDMLMLDDKDALRATLAAVANVAHENSVAAPAEKPINKVAVLVTPVMEKAAQELGFARDDYDFPMVVHVLDPSISPEEVAPERWYISAND